MSQGYRIARTQWECEYIARGLGLKVTTATWSGWDSTCGKPLDRIDLDNIWTICKNCNRPGQYDLHGQYLRCVYFPDELYFHDKLSWNPNCGDNANINLNDTSKYINLCIDGN